MEFQQQLQTIANVNLFDEFAYDDDDDVFYSELRKQVLQLTAEDDDDDQVYAVKNSDMVKARKQDPNDAVSRGYYNWPGIKESRAAAAPPWMLSLWSTGNGTGVFIPQTVRSRRRCRSRRKKNERGRAYKPVEKMN